MTPLEIIALIFAVLVLVKALLLAVAPHVPSEASAFFYRVPLVAVILLSLALVVVGYYVIREIPAVTIAAVMLFSSIAFGLVLMSYAKATRAFQDRVFREGFGKAWPAMIVWAGIAVWVLYDIISRMF